MQDIYYTKGEKDRSNSKTVKQLAGGVKDVPKTSAVSTTLRKAPLSSSSNRNVNNQLNECHEQSLVDQKMEVVRSSPATIVTNSQTEGAIASSIALKQETNVQEMKTYSRRSTRLTEKKPEESRVKKDSEKVVKIKTFLEEVNVASEQNVSTVESGAQVEDICPRAAFVEIMAPVFSRDAWRCVWYMIQNDLVHGWGLDFALRRCAEPAHEKIGVVDSQWIVHQHIPSLGGQGEYDKGKSPYDAVGGLLNKCRVSL